MLSRLLVAAIQPLRRSCLVRRARFPPCWGKSLEPSEATAEGDGGPPRAETQAETDEIRIPGWDY